MKLVCSLVLLFSLLGIGVAQDKAAPTKPNTVKVSTETALKIRDAQVKLFNIIQQVQKVDADAAKAKEELTTQGKAAQDEMTAILTSAFADAKLDPKDYVLDDRTWEFVKRPAPVTATPAPAPSTPAPAAKK
jgi:argonaute-like protein implicated in RNA metabolism and viral defense